MLSVVVLLVVMMIDTAQTRNEDEVGRRAELARRVAQSGWRARTPDLDYTARPALLESSYTTNQCRLRHFCRYRQAGALNAPAYRDRHSNPSHASASHPPSAKASIDPEPVHLQTTCRPKHTTSPCRNVHKQKKATE
jgi:hypothetical protein